MFLNTKMIKEVQFIQNTELKILIYTTILKEIKLIHWDLELIHIKITFHYKEIQFKTAGGG